MSASHEPRAAKLHSYKTSARLAIARADRHMQLFPYQSEARILIRDMRLALVDLVHEFESIHDAPAIPARANLQGDHR